MSTPGYLPDSVDGRRLAQEECDRLHFLKNTPPKPTINGMELTFPPYEYRPFPAVMYRGTAEGGRSLSASEQAELEEHGRYSRLVQTEAERRELLARGWAETPDGVKSAQTKLDEAVAQAAAERAYDDQRMSQKARAEFHAADVANGDDHLLDLPAPKKRGRPKKVTTAA